MSGRTTTKAPLPHVGVRKSVIQHPPQHVGGSGGLIPSPPPASQHHATVSNHRPSVIRSGVLSPRSSVHTSAAAAGSASTSAATEAPIVTAAVPPAVSAANKLAAALNASSAMNSPPPPAPPTQAIAPAPGAQPFPLQRRPSAFVKLFSAAPANGNLTATASATATPLVTAPVVTTSAYTNTSNGAGTGTVPGLRPAPSSDDAVIAIAPHPPPQRGSISVPPSVQPHPPAAGGADTAVSASPSQRRVTLPPGMSIKLVTAPKLIVSPQPPAPVEPVTPARGRGQSAAAPAIETALPNATISVLPPVSSASPASKSNVPAAPRDVPLGLPAAVAIVQPSAATKGIETKDNLILGASSIDSIKKLITGNQSTSIFTATLTRLKIKRSNINSLFTVPAVPQPPPGLKSNASNSGAGGGAQPFSLLVLAAHYLQPELITVLLSIGADPNRQSATLSPVITCAVALAGSGALPPNAQVSAGTYTNTAPRLVTPLMESLLTPLDAKKQKGADRQESVKRLITYISATSAFGKDGVIRELRSVDSHGVTALEHALHSERHVEFGMLVSAGAVDANLLVARHWIDGVIGSPTNAQAVAAAQSAAANAASGIPTTTLVDEIGCRDKWFDELVLLIEKYGASLTPKSIGWGPGGVTGSRQIEYLAYRDLLKPVMNPRPKPGGSRDGKPDTKLDLMIAAWEHSAQVGTARREHELKTNPPQQPAATVTPPVVMTGRRSPVLTGRRTGADLSDEKKTSAVADSGSSISRRGTMPVLSARRGGADVVSPVDVKPVTGTALGSAPANGGNSGTGSSLFGGAPLSRATLRQSGRGTLSKPLEKSCVLCHKSFAFAEFFKLVCSHEYCRSCWHDMMQDSIEKTFHLTFQGLVNCPHPNCSEKVPFDFVCENILNTKEMAFVNAVMSTVPSSPALLKKVADRTITLEDMALYFDGDAACSSGGVLRQKQTKHAFVYCDDAHWDAVGWAVIRHVQSLMINSKKYQMRQVVLPIQLKNVNRLTFHAGDSGVMDHILQLYTAGSLTTGGAAPIKALPPSIVSSKIDVKSNDLNLSIHDLSDTSTCPIWVSANVFTASEVIILIAGGGANRPGVWSRSPVANDSLKAGSVLPYLDACLAAAPTNAPSNGDDSNAASAGGAAAASDTTAGSSAAAPAASSCAMTYGVIILNPNHTHAGLTPDQSREISDSEPIRLKPEESAKLAHALYVWDHFIASNRVAATSIGIVAHGTGGRAAMALLRYRFADATKRVKAIAFADSSHAVRDTDAKATLQWLRKHAMMWTRSKFPLDTKITDRTKEDTAGCPLVSSGHTAHEWSPGTCVHSVFKFFREKF